MSNNKVLKNTMVIIIFTLLSKVLGFFRETMVASKFGATYSTDIYMFAMGMTSLLFASIGVGLGTTFIPMLTDFIERKIDEERNRFVNNILNSTLIFAGLITVLGLVFSPYIVSIFGPGFKNNIQVFNSAVIVARIIFVSIIFIAIQNVLTGVLQSHSEFSIPASMSIFYNFIYIFYLIFLSNRYGIYGLAVATVIAYFVQFVIHIPKFRALGYKYQLYVNFKDESIKKIVNLMMPVIIGTSVTQVNLVIDRLLATTVSEGAISVLNFANKLNMFVYGIFALAISTVVYPSLSAFSSQENIEGYKNALVKAINSIVLIMIPATIGMVVLRQPIVDILFKRGAFDNNAAHLTAVALLCYSPSMIMYGLRDVLNKAFYSIKDTKTPMINSVIGVLMNIILNLLVVKSMGVAGLALATSISAIVTTVLLIISLNKKLGNMGLGKITITFLKVSFSALLMGGSVYFINSYITIVAGNNFKGNALSVLTSVLVGASIYIIAIHLLKIDEYQYLISVIKNKFLKSRFLRGNINES